MLSRSSSVWRMSEAGLMACSWTSRMADSASAVPSPPAGVVGALTAEPLRLLVRVVEQVGHVLPELLVGGLLGGGGLPAGGLDLLAGIHHLALQRLDVIGHVDHVRADLLGVVAAEHD